MKKLLLGFIFILLLSWMSLYRGETVIADDPVPTPTVDPKVLTRDRVHAFCDPATNPRELRGDFIECPPSPTSPPSQQPTPTPTERPGGGIPQPTATPKPSDGGNGGGGGGGDSGGGGGGGGGTTQAAAPAAAKKPKVKGLSKTSSSNYGVFDIMLLLGVLCLLLYVQSKSAASKRLAPKAVAKARRRYRRS